MIRLRLPLMVVCLVVGLAGPAYAVDAGFDDDYAERVVGLGPRLFESLIIESLVVEYSRGTWTARLVVRHKSFQRSTRRGPPRRTVRAPQNIAPAKPPLPPVPPAPVMDEE